MKFAHKAILALLLVGAAAPALSAQTVLHTLDFEDAGFTRWNTKKLPTKESAVIVSSPVRKGRFALRMELNQSDRVVSKSKRAELQMFGAYLNRELWYAISIFIPEDWEEDPVDEVVTQWNATADEGEDTKRSPPLAIRIQKDHWFITQRWDDRFITPPGNSGYKRILWQGKFKKGAWTDWVVHVRWSYQANGLLEIWQDGLQIVKQNGPNAYNDRKGIRFKIGIYKSKWNDPKNKSLVKKRVLFYDEVRIGSEDANYNDVAPDRR